MMKIGHWMIVILALLCLVGCSPMLDDQYVVITPHEVSESDDSQDYMVAQNYLSLKNVLLEMVAAAETQGKIRFYDYGGDLESDFQAVMEDILNDPLGAYALESVDYDLALVVSYYEGEVTMTYRRTAEEIASIERLQLQSLGQRVELALEDLETEVVVRDTFYTGLDVVALVDSYCDKNPEICVEKPTVTYAAYPDLGYVRTVELFFEYENSAEELMTFRSDIDTSLQAAEEYVRYRQEQLEKLRLLYSFFNQRFVYRFEETNTPMYSFLCKGVASSEGVAKSMEIIWEAMGLESHTVVGTKLGVTYYWNVVEVDGAYYHVDLLDALVRELPTLPMMTDDEMEGYQWDREEYPACDKVNLITPSVPEPTPIPPEGTEDETAEEPEETTEPEPEENFQEEITENDLTIDENVV
ncbi:MAG: hypothetical protein R3Y62_07765 [Eubacteriales bacterium]